MDNTNEQAHVQAIDVNGQTYIPIATIVHQLDGTIEWDNIAKKATMNVRGRNAEVDINDRIIRVDGQEVVVGATPIVQDGRLYVSPDFFEQIGLTTAERA